MLSNTAVALMYFGAIFGIMSPGPPLGGSVQFFLVVIGVGLMLFLLHFLVVYYADWHVSTGTEAENEIQQI